MLLWMVALNLVKWEVSSPLMLASSVVTSLAISCFMSAKIWVCSSVAVRVLGGAMVVMVSGVLLAPPVVCLVMVLD